MYSHNTIDHMIYAHCFECDISSYCTEVTVEIEEPRNLTVTEGPNVTVERCVVIPGSDPIERSDFNVCVSTMDGTAMGKDNNCNTPMYLFTS